jgi:putative SOS response-associated peptidase YedK
MPVVLAPDGEGQWLSGNTSGDPKGLLDSYDGEMDAYPVSTDVNNPSNDSPEVVVEAET